MRSHIYKGIEALITEDGSMKNAEARKVFCPLCYDLLLWAPEDAHFHSTGVKKEVESMLESSKMIEPAIYKAAYLQAFYEVSIVLFLEEAEVFLAVLQDVLQAVLQVRLCSCYIPL